ncbi:MbnP family copper-binding protein [Sessilibacter sp. MAH2]
MNKLFKLSSAGVFSAVLASCGSSEKVSTVEFQLIYGSQPLDCSRAFEMDGREWVLDALQMYVSQIRFADKEASLINQSDKETQAAMLGTRCKGSGRWVVNMKPVSLESETNLSFLLGLPFELNHGNPLLAEEPLNHSDMFWTWQLGHKFIRMDVRSEVSEEKTEHWAFHLGSIGCDSASSMRAPAESCAHANTFEVMINDFKPNAPVYIHVDRLIENAQLTKDNCMGNPDDEACIPLLKNLAAESQGGRIFSQTM